MVRRGGFDGSVVAVNPSGNVIEGYPCVPSLRAVGASPDVAVLSVRNERLEETLAEAIEIGARSAVIFASGFIPDDSDPPLSQRLASMARDAGIPICGGNCMGFYNDLDKVWVCGFPSPRQPLPGTIAFIAHSGSVFGALAHNDPRLRFALAISPGQELTTSAADYMDYALGRSEVNVIGLFLETARDPKAFRAALEKAAKRKVPVVILKVGRTEASATAALTHTGALAGSDLAYEALFDRYGVIRVETLDELASTLLIFSTGRQAAPGSLVSIHDSGGERELIIDLADRIDVEFAKISVGTKVEIAKYLDPGLEPANPLDAWGTGANFVPQFEACLDALLADDNAALGLFAADIRDNYYLSDGFAEAAIAAALKTTKPVALVTNYTQVRHDEIALRLTEAGVPVLDGTLNGLIAARGMMRYRDFKARGIDAPAALAHSDAGQLWQELPECGPLDETTSLAVLAAHGMPVVGYELVTSEAEVLAAADCLGYPVALKTAEKRILHKSDAGGVLLDIRDAFALASAWRDLAVRLGPRAVVAQMVPKGVEIALGMVRDPQFGPVVTIGAGGLLIELLTDRCAALAPFGPQTAKRLLDRLALRRLLDGYRGSAAVDLERLAEVISRFSVLAADRVGEIAEIDVNPLICGPR